MMVLTEKLNESKRNSRLPLPPAAGERLEGRPSAGSASVEAEGGQFVADQLAALRRDYAKLQQAIYEAAQIQRRLCAPRDLLWGEFEIAGEIFPVRHLSGDFFKVMELPDSLALALGDIAGKGLSAGIWQAHQMGLIQRAARRHADPAAAVAEVNRELSEDPGAPPLTALFFATLDRPSGELRYCNAGLPAPILLRGNNKAMERLEEGGPMLGAVKNAQFSTGSVTLHPGDTVVAYSDGVTECRNAEDEEFEMDRLIAAAKAVTGVNASKALFSLLGTVLDFAGACPPGDDVTLLAVRRRDSTKAQQGRPRAKDCSAPLRRQATVPRPKA